MDAIDRARDLVPLWADLAAVALHVGVVSGFAWLPAALFARAGRRRLDALDEAPWPERARAIFPHRFALSAMTGGGMVAVAYLTATSRGPLAWSPAALAVLAAATAYLGITCARLGLERRVRRADVTVRAWLASGAVIAFLILPHFVVTLAMWFLLPDRGAGLWIGGIVGVVAMVGLALGGGLQLGRALGVVRPAGERLARITAAAADRAGVPVAGVYEAAMLDANALALPHAGRLVFTRAALETLDDAQLAALAAHELAHLGEPRAVRLARLGGIVVLFPLAFLGPLRAQGGWPAVGLALAAALLVSFLVRRMARRMEERADEHAQGAEAEPGTYARALEALHRANLTPAVMPGKRHIHPHLYDRLVAAGAAPEYERPDPPRGFLVRLSWAVAVLALALASALWPVPVRAIDAAPAQWVALAAQGRSRRQVARVAEIERARGRGADAATLYAAAAEMNPRSPRWPAHQADVLLDLGRLDEAEAALREAARRVREYDRPTPLIESVSTRLRAARGG